MLVLCCQVFLGAATIWTGKSADIATAHVAFGALSLLLGSLLTILSFRMLRSPALKVDGIAPIPLKHAHESSLG
jgi:cytochrome c oxidase assembly protein subunit 15